MVSFVLGFIVLIGTPIMIKDILVLKHICNHDNYKRSFYVYCHLLRYLPQLLHDSLQVSFIFPLVAVGKQ